MAGRVLLAPDPDREGEAIAWHIAEEIRDVEPEHPARAVQRDHEEGASPRPSRSPMALDVKKFESQQARRILDRLVGYEISPVLWTKVRRGLSAGPRAVGRGAPGRRARGRDQRVHAEEYWTVEATVEGPDAAAVHRQGDASSTARSWR